MKHSTFNTSKVFFTIALSVLALAVGASAYDEPSARYPVNTREPIDQGLNYQAKGGGLSVREFWARGNAGFMQDLEIRGPIYGGLAATSLGSKSTVTIGTNLEALVGDVRAVQSLHSDTLIHTESQPKPVCNDTNGNIVFCPTATAVTDRCRNIPGVQSTLHPDVSIDSSDPTFCNQVIRGKIGVNRKGVLADNMSKNASLATIDITNIDIASVGGTSTTVWPSPTPLSFKWGVCAKWNPSYTGPYILATYSNTNPDQGAAGSSNPQKDPNGTCFAFPTSFVSVFERTPTLPYLSGNAHLVDTNYPDADRNAHRTATGYGSSGFTTGYTFNGVNWTSYNGYQIGYNKNNPSVPEIILPVEKLILYQVQVPRGYTLELDALPTQTVVEIYYK